jgi:hypothetical protein
VVPERALSAAVSAAQHVARRDVSGGMRVRRESGKGAGGASGAGWRDGAGQIRTGAGLSAAEEKGEG